MAVVLNEACQLWLEQRVEEELAEGNENSLREIGRTIAAEIEKVFEVKVKPRSIEKRAERMRATNVAPTENPHKQREFRGSCGAQISRDQAIDEVEKRVAAGEPLKTTAREVSKKTDIGEHGLRNAVKRKKQKKLALTAKVVTSKAKTPPHKTDFAIRYAKMAIADLECIGDHPDKEEAFDLVATWIKKHRG
jgi:Holliday junction resolvase-like predicted endonuclease